MLLEKISQKNNIIECSDGNVFSDKLAAKLFSVKGAGEIYWEFYEERDGEVSIKVNFFEPTEVYEIQWNVTDNTKYESMWIDESLDGLNWYKIEKTNVFGWSELKDLSTKHIRLVFCNVKSGFIFNDLKIFGEEKYTLQKELISINSNKYYPQRFFEKFNLIPSLITGFYNMLEENLPDETIKPFFKSGGCTVSVSMIFDEGGEGSGAINSYPINTIPINTGSATTYSGLGAAIINRILAGDAYYDLDGRITDPTLHPSSLGLRFNSTIECESDGNAGHGNNPGGVDQDNPGNSTGSQGQGQGIKYRWEFNDPFHTNVPNNPTTLIVTQYGEVVHNFTMLGSYDVSFFMTIQGNDISDTINVQIAPSPVYVEGDELAVDGGIYMFHGLTRWAPGGVFADYGYYQPEIVLEDNNTPSNATLFDNEDRTFTLHQNGETRDSIIRIFDKYYAEWRYFNITFTETEYDYSE